MRKNFRKLPLSLALAVLAPGTAAAAQAGSAPSRPTEHMEAAAIGAVPVTAQPPQFSLSGETELTELLDAYGLALPRVAHRDKTVADLFERAHPKGRSRVGSKVTLGPLAFVAREVEGGRVTQSGLLLPKSLRV